MSEIQLRDLLTSWQSLKYFKESHPVDTDKYSVAQEIDHDPAFNWWFKALSKKRLRIISLVKKRNTHYLKKTQKFGI